MNTPLTPAGMYAAPAYPTEQFAPKFSQEQTDYISHTIIPRVMGQASKSVRSELREAQKKIRELEAVVNAAPTLQLELKLLATQGKTAELEAQLTKGRESLVKTLALLS